MSPAVPHSVLLLGVMLRRLLPLLLLLLCPACQSAKSWWQVDFRIDINGKPEQVSHLYLIVAPGETMERAASSAEGLGQLVLGDRSTFIEFYEFKLERDPVLGRRWVPKHDESKAGLERLTEQETKNAGLGEQLRLKISRTGFQSAGNQRIAVVAKYKSEDPWQGSLLEADQFRQRARAIVTLSASELHVYYSDALK